MLQRYFLVLCNQSSRCETIVAVPLLLCGPLMTSLQKLSGDIGLYHKRIWRIKRPWHNVKVLSSSDLAFQTKIHNVSIFPNKWCNKLKRKKLTLLRSQKKTLRYWFSGVFSDPKPSQTSLQQFSVWLPPGIHRITKINSKSILVWWMGVDYELFCATLCTRSVLLVIHSLGYIFTPSRIQIHGFRPVCTPSQKKVVLAAFMVVIHQTI